jgi:hypothetical protein
VIYHCRKRLDSTQYLALQNSFLQQGCKINRVRWVSFRGTTAYCGTVSQFQFPTFHCNYAVPKNILFWAARCFWINLLDFLTARIFCTRLGSIIAPLQQLTFISCEASSWFFSCTGHADRLDPQPEHTLRSRPAQNAQHQHPSACH